MGRTEAINGMLADFEEQGARALKGHEIKNLVVVRDDWGRSRVLLGGTFPQKERPDDGLVIEVAKQHIDAVAGGEFSLKKIARGVTVQPVIRENGVYIRKVETETKIPGLMLGMSETIKGGRVQGTTLYVRGPKEDPLHRFLGRLLGVGPRARKAPLSMRSLDY